MRSVTLKARAVEGGRELSPIPQNGAPSRTYPYKGYQSGVKTPEKISLLSLRCTPGALEDGSLTVDGFNPDGSFNGWSLRL